MQSAGTCRHRLELQFCRLWGGSRRHGRQGRVREGCRASPSLACAAQVDARSDGGLLLELYTRDGVGGASMISTDLYEGIRR